VRGRRGGPAALALCLVCLAMGPGPVPGARAATFTVVNLDGPGEGFNDPSPRPSAPGNPGTTLGAQRLFAFRAAAAAWGSVLESTVPIVVEAQMDPLFPCEPLGGILGQAGPDGVFHDFPGAPRANLWYPSALADSLAGRDLNPGVSDISATFNSAVDDSPTCFSNTVWWYGIGAPAPVGTVDFFNTVLHELAHGLGMSTFVNVSTGQKLLGLDDAYMLWLEDHSRGLRWPFLSDAQRAASATDDGDLHWAGPQVVADSDVLSNGRHPSGHVLMYAPPMLRPGSSVSHWDIVLEPDEVMEPFLVAGAADRLTSALLRDMGWRLIAGGGGGADDVIFSDDFETGDLRRWDAVR
jgi:hypothetical protein